MSLKSSPATPGTAAPASLHLSCEAEHRLGSARGGVSMVATANTSNHSNHVHTAEPMPAVQQPSTASPAQPSMPTDVPGLLQRFLEVHQLRAHHYARLHMGFRRFLENKLEGQYKALLQELTTAFSQCSLQVRAVESGLRDAQRQDLATLLDSIQGNERTKLQMELSLQALKQAGAAGVFSWQKPPPPEGVGPLGSAASLQGCSCHEHEEPDPLGPRSTHHHHHHHHHDHSHGAACQPPAAPPEPTEEEYSGAVQESIQQLDRCVATINDFIEEIKEALEEIREGQ